MPTNVVSIQNSKKHYTTSERETREAAESTAQRPRIKLKPSEMLKSDWAAMKLWNETTKKMKGISLLDDLDSEMLSEYCIQSATRDRLRTQYQKYGDSNFLKMVQTQERIILAYANKLGLTPESRVRLAKKKAEERPVNKDEMFGD